MAVSATYGEKKDLVLMDNNVTASSRYQNIIAEIRDLGFTPGAVVRRADGSSSKRRVDFNQGVDARILGQVAHVPARDGHNLYQSTPDCV